MELTEIMQKSVCMLFLVSYLTGIVGASEDYIVRWDFNGNSNDNFGNPGVNSNIYFQNDTAIFNGKSLIRIPDRASFSFDKGITLAAFIKPRTIKQSYIIFKGNKNSETGVFLLQINDRGHFEAGLFDKINGIPRWNALVETTEMIIQDKLYKVVFTYDNKTARLYVNNKLVNQKFFGKTMLQITDDIIFGNRLDLERGFIGSFYEVEIVNYALTEEEVAKRYTLESSEIFGNSECEGYENKDNSPDDCGLRTTSRNIGDIYHSKNETIASWKQLVSAHQDIASYEVIGKSIEGRNIYLFKFGNSSGGKFMFDGQIHGAEDCGTETGYKFVKWVLESNDTEAIRIRNNNYLLAIPIINMDTTSRQNKRRFNDDGTLVPYGVDLNRNFDQDWAGILTLNPLDNYNYRGQAAASEPETRAVTYAIQKYKPAVYMNVHCGAQSLHYYSLTATTAKIINRIGEISNKTGSSTMSLYPISGAQPRGQLHSKAGALGASAWIFELSRWNDLPLTLSEYHYKWYKQVFPVYAAMSNGAEKPSS